MSDKNEDAPAPTRRKGSAMKKILIAVGAVLLVGGGVGGGLYATGMTRPLPAPTRAHRIEFAGSPTTRVTARPAEWKDDT